MSVSELDLTRSGELEAALCGRIHFYRFNRLTRVRKIWFHPQVVIEGGSMYKVGFVLVVLFLLGGSRAMAQSSAAGPFDGNWLTKLTCPAKGSTEGYTWQFASVIQNSDFRGEHGTAGQPGYLLIEGKIAPDGGSKLSANGIVASRKYARGVFAHQGEEYSYNIKAQFKETEGTGARDAGLGIVGRACTFEFAKERATVPADREGNR
jgi:hypothetical protein